MPRRAVLIGGCAAALAWPARSAAQAIFVSAYPLPFTQIAVNGVRATALIDTGSVQPIQLSAALAERAAIAPERELGTNRRYQGGGRRIFAATARQLEIADFAGANEPVRLVAGDIERIAVQVGTEFDAIIGWPFLSRFDFALDYRALTLRLRDSGANEGGQMIALAPGRPLPVASGALRDGAREEINLLIDTGAPLCNLDVSLSERPAGAVVERSLAIAGREMKLAFRVKDLTPIRTALGCAAALGHNFLESRRVRFARATRTLALS